MTTDEFSSVDLLAIDEDRQFLAIEYSRIGLRLRALSAMLSFAAILILGPFSGALALRDSVDRFTGIWQLRVLLFFAVLGIASGILELPLTYFRGFVLPHRYGLSNQSLRQWLADVAKGAAIAAVLGIGTIEVLYGLLRLAPDAWWIWSGILFTLFTVVLSALAPVLILPLFFRLKPLADPGLAAAVLALAQRARTHVASVCEINLSSKTPAANAAVIGLGATRKIVLGDTLIESFPRAEVEVVVAHELAHHVHRDVTKGLLLDSALSIAGFYLANLALHAAARHWRYAGVWDLGALPILAATLGIWGALSGVLGRWFSRRMETAADAFSLQLTDYGVAFVNSEIRLTNQNLSRLRPPLLQESLLYTHPAPWRRIAMGQQYLAARVQSISE